MKVEGWNLSEGRKCYKGKCKGEQKKVMRRKAITSCVICYRSLYLSGQAKAEEGLFPGKGRIKKIRQWQREDMYENIMMKNITLYVA